MKTFQENPAVASFVKAVIVTGFTYVGYAAGGLLLVAILNARAGATGTGLFAIKAADTALKTQFMFLLFLINKPLAIFWIAHKWQANQIALWSIFLFFWFIDASGLWLYQMLVFGTVSIPTVLVLGFFSAIIIVTSIQRNYRKSGARQHPQT